MTKHKIKNPTVRKIRRRGLTPIRYRAEGGYHHGWIESRGRKWLHLNLVGLGAVKIPLSQEAELVTELK